MSTPSGPPVDGEALAALRSEIRARGRGLRLGDTFDALLVRELQQALGSRVFVVLVALALVAMLGLVISVLGDTRGLLTRGSDAFSGVLWILSMLVCAVVPLQAFGATRQEAVGESAEALLLTRLTPWAIVRGKLTAANAHMLLWVTLAAPLLALTWMLRGVSVPQILFGLLLVMLGSMVISALAVAAGTLARFERLNALVNLLGLGGILAAAFGWTAFTQYSVGDSSIRLDGEAIAVMLGFVVPLLAFAIMVARSQFTHPFENRSTPFRVLPVAGVLLGFAIMAPWVRDEDPYLVLLASGAAVISVFLVFAATEEDGLSPWLALRVPRDPLRARLAAPFLPGGARGLLWGLLATALLVAGISATEALVGRNLSLFLQDGTTTYHSSAARAIVLIATYGLFYGALGALVRPRLRPGVAGNWIARSFVLGFLLVASLVPILIQLLLLRDSNWTLLQVFNPFWSISEGTDSALLQGPVFPGLAFVTALVVLPQVSRLIRGVTDIVAAGAARGSREG